MIYFLLITNTCLYSFSGMLKVEHIKMEKRGDQSAFFLINYSLHLNLFVLYSIFRIS